MPHIFDLSQPSDYNAIIMATYVLAVEIRPLDDGGYLATSPNLPGFLVQAETVEKTLELAPGVAQALIEAMRQKEVPLPQTLQTIEPPFHTDLPLCRYD